jgi:hypothetical protein
MTPRAEQIGSALNALQEAWGFVRTLQRTEVIRKIQEARRHAGMLTTAKPPGRWNPDRCVASIIAAAHELAFAHALLRRARGADLSAPLSFADQHLVQALEDA